MYMTLPYSIAPIVCSFLRHQAGKPSMRKWSASQEPWSWAERVAEEMKVTYICQGSKAVKGVVKVAYIVIIETERG